MQCTKSLFAKNGVDPAKNRDKGLVKGLRMESGDKSGVDKSFGCCKNHLVIYIGM